MFKHNYNVIGVMSGTSLDGIDMAHISFSFENNKWNYTILEAETIAYDGNWVETLKKAINFEPQELLKLNKDYTQYLGNKIFDFIEKHKIKNLDAVCSHGHTILHQPQNGFTLQIGNLPEIATLCKQKVVCDFRVQDVALGGQGAPLVPVGDRLLFSEYEYCLNLGGFSNISFENDGKRIAFDISPVNTVLNFYANKLGFDYDESGNLAKNGKVDEILLKELNALPFYKISFPKSLGFEFVQGTILPILEKHNVNAEDVLATFTEHVAVQIYEVLKNKTGKLLITGGGAYNTFLIDKLKSKLPNIVIVVPDAKTLEFKEALIFAFLGVLRLNNQTNVLSSVTGAYKNHSSGKIFY